MENEQIIVATDDSLGSRGEREFQILVIFWITAVSHPYGRLKPYGRAPQDFQDPASPCKRDCMRKLRAVQDPGNLGIDRGGESEHVDFFGAQQSTFGNTVNLQCRAYEG